MTDRILDFLDLKAATSVGLTAFIASWIAYIFGRKRNAAETDSIKVANTAAGIELTKSTATAYQNIINDLNIRCADLLKDLKNTEADLLASLKKSRDLEKKAICMQSEIDAMQRYACFRSNCETRINSSESCILKK
jgi:hypothetical protein